MFLKRINKILKETGHKVLSECTFWQMPGHFIIVVSEKTKVPRFLIQWDEQWEEVVYFAECLDLKYVK